MASIKLSAPVGLDPRTSDGPPVQNKSADVVLVRQMLRANGMPSSTSGSVDAGLLKLITLMQKKAGVKPTDQVVDPGGRTFRALLPKYAKEVAELGEGTRVLVTFKGKELCVSKKDFDAIQKAAQDEMKAYVEILQGSLDNNMKMLEHWQDVLKGGEGYLKAISFILVANPLMVTPPSAALAGKAAGTIKAARAAAAAGNFKAIEKALPAAEKAANAFTDDMIRFASAYGRSAKRVHFTLSVTQGVGWMVVGALATPVLIGAGMGAGGAAVVGSAGTAMLQSAVNELGKHVSGQERTMWESLRDVIVDTFVGGVVGKLGTLKLGFVSDVAKKLTPGIAAQLEGYASKQVLEKFVLRYLTNTGKAVFTDLVAEVFKTAGETVKKGGKPPTQAELMDKCVKIARNAVLAGPFGEMARFQKAWVHRKKPEIIEKKLCPDILDKKFKKVEMTERQRRDVIAKVVSGSSKLGTNTVIDGVIGAASGSENAGALEKQAEKLLLNDSAVRAALEKAIDAEIKRLKIPAG